MNTIKTQLIQTSGTLAVIVTGTAGYVGGQTRISASWTPDLNPSYIAVDWGDGLYDTPENLVRSPQLFSHVYTAPGSKTVTVTVADPTAGMGGIGTLTFNVAALLTSTFMANPTGGKVPLAVTFTFQITGGFPTFTWTLNYGDGTTQGSGTAPVNPPLITNAHTYAKVGSFTATLTVTDAYGAIFSAPLGVSGLLEEPILLEHLLVVGGITLTTTILGKVLTKNKKKKGSLTPLFALSGIALGVAVQRLRGRL